MEVLRIRSWGLGIRKSKNVDRKQQYKRDKK